MKMSLEMTPKFCSPSKKYFVNRVASDMFSTRESPRVREERVVPLRIPVKTMTYA